MNIIKQELYLARKNKNKDLHILLSQLVFKSLAYEGCICFEMYQSDDDINEFLIYSEFKDDNSLQNYEKSVFEKVFMGVYDEIVLKKEVLPSL